MNLQPGDIVFFKGKSVFSKLVNYFTSSDITHAAMLISPETMIEANWYKRTNVVKFKYDEKSMEIYRLKEGLDVSQQILVIQSSLQMLDDYYDYFQLINYIFEKFKRRQYINPLNAPNYIICSELIDRTYKELDIDLVHRRSLGNVTPKDLHSSRKIVRIY